MKNGYKKVSLLVKMARKDRAKSGSSKGTKAAQALGGQDQDLAYVSRIIDDSMSRNAIKIIKEGQKNCFYIFDPKAVSDRITLWESQLPEVEMFYAVKANQDPVIIKKVIERGHGFDCASIGEINKVMGFGCPAEKIIYAHPVK